MQREELSKVREPLPEQDDPRRESSSVFRSRNFMLYVTGVMFSQIGTQATFAAMLYHVYLLSGSTLQVGLVGLSRGIAILVLSPLGGFYADRLDRRRLLQVSQAVSMSVSIGLAIVSLLGIAQTWHVLLAALLNSAATTFDSPTRKALVPALVPATQLVKAFALVNPTNQVGKLAGPALAGLLLAIGGPGVVYAFDTVTFLGLILLLGVLRVPAVPPRDRSTTMWSSIVEGAMFVRRRPLIMQFIALDLSTTLFAAYRVLLPALAVDVLLVGATGYGMLAAAPPAGALLGGAVAYRLAGTSVASGKIVLACTAGIGLAAIGLAHTRTFVLALGAVAAIGLLDSVATVIRHAVVLLETPDELRGRVSALYGMASSGGPALGELNVGWLATILGISASLTLGGSIPIIYALVVIASSRTVRSYRATDETN